MIAGDNTVNIAEKAEGFAISGATGTEAGVTVTLKVGTATLSATSADDNGTATWSVSVPVAAVYITGASVVVTVSAAKTGFTAPADVQRTLTIDLTAPGSLKVGAAITTMSPTGAIGVNEYSASGLPTGLSIDDGTGVISGTPTAAATATASVTVTVNDAAGNTDTVDITFPAVAKGDQTLSGFSYSASSVTFGSAAPTVTAPSGVETTLSYAASPSNVCTVDAATGALTLTGVGSCAVTVTAAATADYEEATATATVTVNSAGALTLNVDTIAGDDIINIAEKADGFAISGATGTEAGVTVTVQVGTATLSATSADESGMATWSVSVPADASYITGASVDVRVTASKAGYTSPSAVQRTLTVDLVAPVAPTYTAPGSLKVGAAITSMSPTGDSGVNEYDAPGLPTGLSINASTGVISGTPTAAATATASVTVTVSDTAGNTDTVDITFPMVAKGDQTLSGFSYSASSVTFGSAAPTLTAPGGAQGALSYAATPATACTVDAATGALTLTGVGSCAVTVTAAATADYNAATDTATVTVQTAGTLVLNVDAVTGDDTVNIAEKADGFAISGNTGTEAGVAVTVQVGTGTLSATSADESGMATWSVSVPVAAGYITGTSVDVSVTAAKTGFTAPADVQRTLTVDLVAPVAPTYTAPGSLKVGAAITAMSPTGDNGVNEYDASGLPTGLSINASTGVISGTPTAAATGAVSVTVTVNDAAGNTDTVDITFPAVAKGDQTLIGFSYSASSVTFGSAVPTVTAPSGAKGALSYAATPSTVCTVEAATGVLMLAGVGSCAVTVTAAATADYNAATDSYTVTVQTAGSLVLNLDTIAGDDTINIAEKADGFAISGATGTEAGVTVTVQVGTATLSATLAGDNGTATWSVSVPADAVYITGTSVVVTVSAAKTGFTAPADVQRTLTIDLTVPTAPSYTAPGSLKVGAAITTMSPTGAIGVNEYDASGLPTGLSINASTGVISGTPTAAATGAASVTVTVSDTAGNSATVGITFPMVAKGDQTLSGFSYSASSVTFGSAAPTVTAPGGAQGALSYAATPSTVCTVEAATGVLTLAGVGSCAVTVTAAATADYNAATDTATVTVQTAGSLVLNVDAVTGDDTVNIAEKAEGFAIGGNTGSEAGVTVTVQVGTATLSATSADDNGTATWSVSVPADAVYITGTSVVVTVSAAKTGFTAPADVQRTLTIDLTVPTAPSYTAPGSLKVGAAITTMSPTGAIGVNEYSASGLPTGLSIDDGTGVISGTPTAAATATASVTVTVNDAAGNTDTVDITFPVVAKGDQTLSGFSYSASSVTFGSAAPTLTVPGGAQGDLSYAATPSTVCTVEAATGVLTLAGVGSCAVTVTAAATADYNAATDTATVTVQTAGSLVLNVDAVTGDDTVNIAEKAKGFAIGGNTGSEAGVTVTVQVGTATLSATSADDNGTATWSVSVPADAVYITGTSVVVTVSAAKTGFTAPADVQRTLTIDLTVPTAPSYTAPGSLKVGAAITTMSPTGAIGVNEYDASGLPTGLSINASTGVISGTPTAAATATASVTVTVNDAAGNTDTVDITFPVVAKGDQTLSGFSYSASSVTFGSAAPTLTAPGGAQGDISYTATPSTVCTVEAATGVLTLAGLGSCTVTAAATADYEEATATATVTVNSAGALTLNVDTIAGDDIINIAEKAEGFAISGDTGTEAGVAVTVQVGATTLSATSADDSGTATWSVSVPVAAGYITGTSVDVRVSAAKTGFTAPADVQRTLTVDLDAPEVVSIVRHSPAASPTDEDSLVWRVTFSEAIANADAADFEVTGTTATLTVAPVSGADAIDVTVTGGDLAALDATVTLSFAAAQDIADAAGIALADTAPTGANEAEYVLDNTAPLPVDPVAARIEGATLVVTFNEVLDGASAPANARFTVNKTPSGGSPGDAALTGAPAIADSTVTLTLAAAVVFDDTVTVAYDASGSGNRLRDPAGNEVVNFSETATNDTNSPPRVVSVVRHSPAASPTNADSLVWRVTFSEAVVNEDAADFAVTGTTATITVAPVTGADAVDVTVTGGDLTDLDGTVTLAFTSAQDITDDEGNALSSAAPTGTNDPTYLLDNTAPSVTAAAVGGTVLSLTFDEPVDSFSGRSDDGGFAVKIGASSGPAVTAVAVDGTDATKLRFTLASAIADGTQDVTLEYDPPDSGAKVRDAVGNDVEGFTGNDAPDVSVTPDTTAPEVSGTPTVDGATLAVTFDEALDAASVPAAPGGFTVTVTRGSSTVSGHTVSALSLSSSGTVLTLTLAQGVLAGDLVTLAYAKPSTPLRDRATTPNDVANFTTGPAAYWRLSTGPRRWNWRSRRRRRWRATTRRSR